MFPCKGNPAKRKGRVGMVQKGFKMTPTREAFTTSLGARGSFDWLGWIQSGFYLLGSKYKALNLDSSWNSSNQLPFCISSLGTWVCLKIGNPVWTLLKGNPKEINHLVLANQRLQSRLGARVGVRGTAVALLRRRHEKKSTGEANLTRISNNKWFSHRSDLVK